MNAGERRQEIYERLCQRKFDTAVNLAVEFHVSRRTILYDIEALTLSHPVETVRGRYGGGVRIADSYCQRRNYLSPSQASLLTRLSAELHGDDLGVMNSILSQFAPQYRAE